MSAIFQAIGSLFGGGGGGGGGQSYQQQQPSVQLPSVPTPPPPTAPPPTAGSAKVQADAASATLPYERGAGLQSTILTGGLGDQSAASLRKKTLLGA